MLGQLFSSPSDKLLLIIASTIGIYITIITYTRIAGLRSFSKMSSFDFATTVAAGSLMATVAVTQTVLLEGMVALATLYVLQISVALLRRFALMRQLVDNQPLLLMHGTELLESNMKQARITETDIKSKLREANVTDVRTVHAVVLESTGEISVLHGGKTIDAAIVDNVRDADAIKSIKVKHHRR